MQNPQNFVIGSLMDYLVSDLLLDYILCVSIPLIVQNIFYKDAINGQDFLFVEITIIGSHMIKTSELHLQTAGSDFGAASQTFQQE